MAVQCRVAHASDEDDGVVFGSGDLLFCSGFGAFLLSFLPLLPPLSWFQCAAYGHQKATGDGRSLGLWGWGSYSRSFELHGGRLRIAPSASSGFARHGWLAWRWRGRCTKGGARPWPGRDPLARPTIAVGALSHGGLSAAWGRKTVALTCRVQQAAAASGDRETHGHGQRAVDTRGQGCSNCKRG